MGMKKAEGSQLAANARIAELIAKMKPASPTFARRLYLGRTAFLATAS